MSDDHIQQTGDELIEQAKDDAFCLLSFRERSQAELEERLARKGYSNDVIAAVISRLKEMDYLNDRRFAEKWVRYRIKYKPRGKRLLRLELRKKGIDERIAGQVLNELVSDDVELDLGLRVARKWLKSHPNQENIILRLKKHLQNKGFGFQLIDRVIASMNKK